MILAGKSGDVVEKNLGIECRFRFQIAEDDHRFFRTILLGEEGP